MPVLAAVVIASLGVGIGVNTVVFSWIQGVVLRPLAGRRGRDRLPPRRTAHRYRDLHRYVVARVSRPCRSAPVVSRAAGVSNGARSTSGEPGQVERSYGLLVSGNYFTTLGLHPALGRFLLADEVTRPGGEPVAVISYDLWQTRFAGAASVLGQTVRVNGRHLTIVGVAPRRFQGTVLGLSFDYWMPATMAPAILTGSRELEDRSVRGYAVMGQLQPGVSLAQAQSELDAAMRQLAQAYPATNATLRGEVLTFGDSPRGPQRFLPTASGGAAGGHAPAAARGLRQHGESGARAGERAPA